MTNRIMLRAWANENTISIQTISAHMKSPHRFYITYGEFDRLQRDGRIISSDIRSFVTIRLDEGRDRIVFAFTWLTGYGIDRVEGTEQTVTLRWSKFQAFLRDCRQPDGPETFKAISLDTHKDRPRIVFVGNKANLRAAIGNPHVRHKLGKALMTNFNWPNADEIHLYNDFDPYSFFFQEIRDGRTRMCGGLILHNQDDPRRMAYSIHT